MNFNEILSAYIDFLLPLLPFVVGACVWVVIFRLCLSLFSCDGKSAISKASTPKDSSKDNSSASDDGFLTGLMTGWLWFK